MRKKGGRYCTIHAFKEKDCSVVECVQAAEVGFKTCRIASHRAVEEHYELKSKAMFQLRARLERLNESQGHQRSMVPETLSTMPPLEVHGSSPDVVPICSTAGEAEDENSEITSEVDGEVECEEKSVEGNRRIKALLGRRHTHNEELCVASCGVILGRATFFGSEAHQ